MTMHAAQCSCSGRGSSQHEQAASLISRALVVHVPTG